MLETHQGQATDSSGRSSWLAWQARQQAAGSPPPPPPPPPAALKLQAAPRPRPRPRAFPLLCPSMLGPRRASPGRWRLARSCRALSTLPSGTGRQRLVVALGGNALLKRGETLSFANQQSAAQLAAPMIVELAKSHEVILVHGNGPQVGALALMEQVRHFIWCCCAVTMVQW
jgi:hypothetical protein